MKKATLLTLIMLLFGVVYWGCEDCPTCLENNAPEIESILINPPIVNTAEIVTLTAVVTDKDNDPIAYHWSCSDGDIYTSSGYGTTTNPARWISPDTAGAYTVTCIVSDGKDTHTKSISITVT